MWVYSQDVCCMKYPCFPYLIIVLADIFSYSIFKNFMNRCSDVAFAIIGFGKFTQKLLVDFTNNYKKTLRNTKLR